MTLESSHTIVDEFENARNERSKSSKKTEEWATSNHANKVKSYRSIRPKQWGDSRSNEGLTGIRPIQIELLHSFRSTATNRSRINDGNRRVWMRKKWRRYLRRRMMIDGKQWPPRCLVVTASCRREREALVLGLLRIPRIVPKAGKDCRGVHNDKINNE
jgi:hypothetical protein